MKHIKQHFFHLKTLQIASLVYACFWEKNILFSVFSKSYWNSASVVKQQGIVLINVLVVVALISTSVTLMFKFQNSVIENIKVINKQANAVQYLLSLESYAKNLLKTDFEDDGNSRVDFYDEEDENQRKWHEEIPNVIENVQFKAQLFDLQANLNLNGLFEFSKQSGQMKEKFSPDFFGCFNRLNLALDSNVTGDNIINYLNEKRLKKITHPSELKNITYIGLKDYQKIRQLLFTLDNAVAINVNTASAEILSCLHPELESETAVDSIISARPYETMNDLHAKLQELMSLSLAEIKTKFNHNFVDIKSSYFVLKTNITIDNLKLKTISMIYRQNASKIAILNRSYYLENANY